MVDFDGSVQRSQHPDGYTVWEPSGHVTADVGSSEVVENVLIDQTGGGSISLRARSGSWTVRNVGWKGIAPSRHESGSHAFLGRVSAGNSGSATIENIFMEGWGTSMGGLWSRPNHGGTLHVRNSYFAGFGNNSCYLSNHGKDGKADGNVIIEGSFSHSSTTGNFRVSGRGTRVRNCVAIADDPGCDRGHYPGQPSAYTARPFTARHWDDQVVEDCSVYVNPNDCSPAPKGAYQAWHCGGCSSNGPRTVLTLKNCHINPEAPNPIGEINGGEVVGSVGNSPTMDHLAALGGVPLTPEMAARGERGIPETPLPGGGNGTPRPTPTRLAISNDGSARTEYEAVVDGDVTSTSGFGLDDEVDRSGEMPVVTGFVRGGTDAFRYNGCIDSFDYTGPEPAVTRDGAQVAPADVPDCEEDPTQPPEPGDPDRFYQAVALGLGLGVGASYLRGRLGRR